MEIGRGAQYRVDDIGGGRVRKTLLTAAESRAVYEPWHEPDGSAFDYLAQAVANAAHVQALLAAYPELSDTLGNPDFESTTAYTQDKVHILGEMLENISTDDARRIIRSYVSLVHTHWRYGFADRIYNPLVNSGINSHGDVILCDFGEITFDRDVAAKSVATTRWLRANSYIEDMPDALKPYYHDYLGEHLTAETFAANWGAALSGDPTPLQ
ncbi:MAG TPA: hypothetical protein VLG11_00795 [Candidatus Saccharimonadales bacterium]|nr:hypothetical protein [Candidatus Saccharimonadales bacterium]